MTGAINTDMQHSLVHGIHTHTHTPSGHVCHCHPQPSTPLLEINYYWHNLPADSHLSGCAGIMGVQKRKVGFCANKDGHWWQDNDCVQNNSTKINVWTLPEPEPEWEKDPSVSVPSFTRLMLPNNKIKLDELDFLARCVTLSPLREQFKTDMKHCCTSVQTSLCEHFAAINPSQTCTHFYWSDGMGTFIFSIEIRISQGRTE